MEQQNQQAESSLFNLSIDPSILNYLSETARWGKFLSILGFIVCGIMFLAGMAIPSMMSRVNSMGMVQGNMFAGAGIGLLLFLYVIIAIIYFFPCLFLLRFSNAVKAAIASEDQFKLTESFKNLKKLFKYIGIVTIVILSFYALAIVIGGFTAFMHY
jgi:Family of unknown function (DUF5362)